MSMHIISGCIPYSLKLLRIQWNGAFKWRLSWYAQMWHTYTRTECELHCEALIWIIASPMICSWPGFLFGCHENFIIISFYDWRVTLWSTHTHAHILSLSHTHTHSMFPPVPKLHFPNTIRALRRVRFHLIWVKRKTQTPEQLKLIKRFMNSLFRAILLASVAMHSTYTYTHTLKHTYFGKITGKLIKTK